MFVLPSVFSLCVKVCLSVCVCVWMVPDNRLDRRWGYDLCRTKKKIIWQLKWDACVHLSPGAKVQSPQEVWGSLQQVALPDLRITHLLITFNVRTFNNVQMSLRKKRKRLQVILWIETQLLVLLNEPGSGRECWAAQGPQGPGKFICWTPTDS